MNFERRSTASWANKLYESDLLFDDMFRDALGERKYILRGLGGNTPIT